MQNILMFCNVKSTAAACKCSSVIICTKKPQCLNRKNLSADIRI